MGNLPLCVNDKEARGKFCFHFLLDILPLGVSQITAKPISYWHCRGRAELMIPERDLMCQRQMAFNDDYQLVVYQLRVTVPR